VDTMFSGEPVESTQYFDEQGNEIAYVILEDGGAGYTILMATNEPAHSILEYVDDRGFHRNPSEYAHELYMEAVNLAETLMNVRFDKVQKLNKKRGKLANEMEERAR